MSGVAFFLFFPCRHPFRVLNKVEKLFRQRGPKQQLCFKFILESTVWVGGENGLPNIELGIGRLPCSVTGSTGNAQVETHLGPLPRLQARLRPWPLSVGVPADSGPDFLLPVPALSCPTLSCGLITTCGLMTLNFCV